MSYRWLGIGVVAIALTPAVAVADPFDNYTNIILTKIPESKSAEKVARLAPENMVASFGALPGIRAAFIVVKTNEGRFARLLVKPALQKIPKGETVPMVLVDRFVTYRESEERTILASGQSLHLFIEFRLSLDIGQVVPANVPADLRVVADKDSYYLEPVGKAEMYLVSMHLPEANPGKAAKLVLGEKFEMRYFNGTYQLHDDGRRSGTLHFKVAENGEVSGHYYSDKDGQKYEVSGKVANNPQHMVNFLISYPRTSQTFVGYLFTGNGRAMTGISRLDGRETGFYAVRIEEDK